MILVTGAAGFIGLNFIKLLKTKGMLDQVVVVDCFTYAANKTELLAVGEFPVVQVDISDKEALSRVFSDHKIDYVVNFAAESHVDNSIRDCSMFIYTNIIGTVNLLQLSVEHKVSRFLQISTDEVFGQVLEGSFTEDSQISPRNPYSASKASAEHFVSAFHNTYGLETLIVNCSNNYGPHQHFEKLIPQTVRGLLRGEEPIVYGRGEQVRDWIYVEDSCEAMFTVLEQGDAGERYCIGGDNEVRNIDLVKKILAMMGYPDDYIRFVKDRPGHDFRYHTSFNKLQLQTGWAPKVDLETGLRETIEWYKQNDYRI